MDAGRMRAVIGGAAAPIVFLTLYFAPLPLEGPAHRLAAIFGAILVLWISEALPIAVTALLVAPLLVMFDVADPKEAFKQYANPLLFLFVGGFFIAEAMREHGLDKRIAKSIVTARWVQGRSSRVLIALLIAGALLSMWISNTATTAVLAPILLGILGPRRDSAATGALLTLAYTCSVGGLGTIVGSPPNLITVGLLAESGHELSFLDWTKIALPTAFVVAVAIYFVTRFLNRKKPGAPSAAPEQTSAAVFDDVPEKWSRGEIVTAFAFGLAVFGWMLPGAIEAGLLVFDSELLRSAKDAVKETLPSSVVALIASAVLFVFRDGEGKRVLTWKRATQIDWGIILLFGGGLALGTQLVATGLADAMGESFIAATGIESLWSLTLVCCVFTIFFTEVCSNTASANMLVPLVIAIAARLGVSPIPPALAVGLAASCAFMLPIATGPNAIVYSTGRVSQPQMIRTGAVLNVVGAVVVFTCIRLLCPLYGWT